MGKAWSENGYEQGYREITCFGLKWGLGLENR